MKVFDINYTDQLTDEQVRYLLKCEMARNRLIIQQNKFAIFRYEAKDDIMVILYQSPEGIMLHEAFDHYSKVCPSVLFDADEHARIIERILSVVNDSSAPRIGSEDFFRKDGTGVCVEYNCVCDQKGEVLSIVGQIIDAFLTHNRMVSTIKMLNDQIAITDSIRRTFETMISFDLRDFSYEVIQGTPEVKAVSSQVKSVLKLAEVFCEYYVDPAYRVGFMEFISEITIEDRLLSNRYISYEYMTKNIGWCRARIMVADIDSSGRVIKGVFTTERSIDTQEELSVLRVAAYRDSLTGLLNRMSGEKAINEILDQGTASIYALLDCDSFKKINDRLGHPVGDQVLISVAHVLTSAFPSEIVMRLGGDEFVVFITSQPLVEKARTEGLEAIFQPMYDGLQQIDIPQLEGHKPSLSCGALFIAPDAPYDLPVIYELADKKLYEAKSDKKGSLVSMEIGWKKRKS